MTHILKCFRVWFTDGSAILVDAADKIDAKKQACILAKEQDRPAVKKIEQLTAQLIG